MKTDGFRLWGKCALSGRLGVAVVAGLLASFACQGEWRRESGSLAWQAGNAVCWRFNFDARDGKAFFDPVAAIPGQSLTVARPGDHPWHYGLWFSWKFINGVNYWEQNAKNGAAEGATRWSEPAIRTSPEGEARIEMRVSYVHPNGRVEMEEHRVVTVSKPAEDGSYTVDWAADFTAGAGGATLGRTPMLGEPGGAVNGGYGGFSLRLAVSPVVLALVSERGPVSEFVSDRARPEARALAANFSRDERMLGGIAVLSAAANVAGGSPWYAVVSKQMRFFCSAILAPKPIVLGAGERLALRYRVCVRATAWDSEALRAALATWNPALVAP